MLKLKRLTIHKHPRVQAGTELVFNDGVNVLLGVNGSGKTTLLELIVMVMQGRLESVPEHELHLSYVFESTEGVCSIEARSFLGPVQRGLQARMLSSWVVRIDPHGGESTTIDIDNDRIEMIYKGTPIRSARSLVVGVPMAAIAARVIDEIAPNDRDLLESEFCTWRLARFDEATRWFDDGIKVVDYVLFEHGDAPVEPTTNDFVPPVIGKLLAEQAKSSEPRDSFKINEKQVDFLAQACNALGFASASMQFDLLRREQASSPQLWAIHLGELRFLFVKADGTRLRHSQLSFGQRRLFAFLYYAAIHGEVIVADELTNGLHHAMIGQCLDVIGERQAFLATQNPLLLDNLVFEDAEQVRRTFILCSTVSDNGRERMVWRNMTADEAENFFRDYKVGISHVNDILRNWGLW